MEFKAKNFSELTTGELYEILRSRSEIFILEQKMHCQDMDGVDYISRHFFIEEKGRVVAYLRAFYTDPNKTVVKIGRVLTLTHGNGLGRAIIEKSIEDIKKNMKCQKICLNSQKSAVGFYENLGFKVVSEEFLEEGVEHLAMEMGLE